MDDPVQVAHEAAAQCDDGCGRVATLVVTDTVSRDVDLLCWPCLMRRALEAAAAVTEAVGDATG